MKKPMTIEDYYKARLIVDPFGMFDCSLNSDGAGAVIVTSTERARSLKQKPVLIKGFATHNNTKGWIEEDHMLSTGADESGERAFKMAGLGPKDVDTAQIYDCFTYMVLTQLEDYGFCKKGEGGEFVRSGALRMGGVAADQHLGRPALGGACRRHAADRRRRAAVAGRLWRRPAGHRCRDRADQRPRRQPGLPLDADPRKGMTPCRRYKKPIPVPSQESQPYWDGLREQKLMMPRCDDCKQLLVPALAALSALQLGELDLDEDERPRPDLQLRGLSPRLSSGVRAGGALRGRGDRAGRGAADVQQCDRHRRPISSVCDMKVEVAYEPITDAITLPKFKPVAA